VAVDGMVLGKTSTFIYNRLKLLEIGLPLGGLR